VKIEGEDQEKTQRVEKELEGKFQMGMTGVKKQECNWLVLEDSFRNHHGESDKIS